MKAPFFQAVPTLQSQRLILRRLTQADAEALDSLAHSDAVYRYLPTFLYEQKYPDIRRVIDGLYDECLRESLILGIFLKEDEAFCGLAEMYAFRASGLLMYTLFKPRCMKLKRKLKACPLCDPCFYSAADPRSESADPGI